MCVRPADVGQPPTDVQKGIQVAHGCQPFTQACVVETRHDGGHHGRGRGRAAHHDTIAWWLVRGHLVDLVVVRGRCQVWKAAAGPVPVLGIRKGDRRRVEIPLYGLFLPRRIGLEREVLARSKAAATRDPGHVVDGPNGGVCGVRSKLGPANRSGMGQTGWEEGVKLEDIVPPAVPDTVVATGHQNTHAKHAQFLDLLIDTDGVAGLDLAAQTAVDALAIRDGPDERRVLVRARERKPSEQIELILLVEPHVCGHARRGRLDVLHVKVGLDAEHLCAVRSGRARARRRPTHWLVGQPENLLKGRERLGVEGLPLKLGRCLARRGVAADRLRVAVAVHGQVVQLGQFGRCDLDLAWPPRRRRTPTS